MLSCGEVYFSVQGNSKVRIYGLNLILCETAVQLKTRKGWAMLSCRVVYYSIVPRKQLFGKSIKFLA